MKPLLQSIAIILFTVLIIGALAKMPIPGEQSPEQQDIANSLRRIEDKVDQCRQLTADRDEALHRDLDEIKAALKRPRR